MPLRFFLLFEAFRDLNGERPASGTLRVGWAAMRRDEPTDPGKEADASDFHGSACVQGLTQGTTTGPAAIKAPHFF